MLRVGVLAALGFAFSCGGAPPPAVLDAADETIWVDDLGPAPELDAADVTPLIAWIDRALEAGVDAAGEPELASHLAGDRAPRIVFVSAGDGRAAATVAMGRGRGLVAATRTALATLGTRRAPWIKLDIVTGAGQARTIDPRRPIGFERSVRGLALARGSGLAFLPEELVVGGLVAADGTFRSERIVRAAARRGRRAVAERIFDGGRQVRVRPFRCASFFRGATGDVYALYRGHRASPSIAPERLFEAAREGGDYLRRSVREDGRFTYAYLPTRDTGDADYNMVRHAGTAYAMLELAGATGEQGLVAAAERALGYMLDHVVPFGAPEVNAGALAYGGKIKLGGVALAVLALVEHVRVTGDDRYLDDARRLARYMVANQQPSGEFVHQRIHPGGEVRPFTSMYYPGEALFALVRLHGVDPDPQWLETAVRGARWLIEVRDRGVPTLELLHDHWLLYALDELDRASPRPLWSEHALRIVTAITSAQRTDLDEPDYVGAYGRKTPRSTPVATRAEGLLAAHGIAVRAGEGEVAARILETVDRGLAIQLGTRITPERAMYLPNPRRALGGFTRSYTNYEVRIDYVQHNISALLARWRIATRASNSAGSGRIDRKTMYQR